MPGEGTTLDRGLMWLVAATFSMNRSSINHYKVHYRGGIAFP